MSDAFSLGGAVFVVEIPDEVAAPFEWLDEPGQTTSWRAFLVPANVLNRYVCARVVPTPVPPQREKSAD
jgi:hypothetical protein